MEEHIKKYKMMEKPSNKKKNNISDSIQNKVADPPQLINSNEPDSIKEDKTLHVFNIDESNVNNSNENNLNMAGYTYSSSNPNSASAPTVFDKIKSLIQSKQTRAVLCPFEDSSGGCKLCYKIFASFTCLILLFVLFSIFSYN